MVVGADSLPPSAPGTHKPIRAYMRSVPSRPFDFSGPTWELASRDAPGHPQWMAWQNPRRIPSPSRSSDASTPPAPSRRRAGCRRAPTSRPASPGFLGSGWVRAGEGSDLWYMLYRFRDIPTLEAWEQSRAARVVARFGPRVRGRGARRAPHRHRGLVRRPVRHARRVARRRTHQRRSRRPARSSSRSPPRRRGGSRPSRSGSGSSRRISSPRGCSGSSRDSRSGRSCCACCSRPWRSRRS